MNLYVLPRVHCFLVPRSEQLLPENDVERIDYILQLYNKMLDFLSSREACLIHVSPQFLLNYNDYLISIDVAQNNVSYKLRFSTIPFFRAA